MPVAIDTTCRRRRPYPGGISSDARKLFAPISHEPTSKTGLHNVTGAIAMANFGAGTARADFFILASDIPSLDATADQPGHNE